jgi:hypothetical protein
MLSVYVCTHVSAMSAFEQVDLVQEFGMNLMPSEVTPAPYYLSMALQSFVGPRPLFSFLIL